MLECTLCFLVDDTKRQVCLGYKKRGFGEGKWNGPGGKIDPGETPEQAMVRELHEEFGVHAHHDDLEKVGLLEFYFETDEVRDIRGHVYFIRTWKGEPSESDEMRPNWFSYDEIPLNDMWEDDQYWLPDLLDGKKLKIAKFTFDADRKLKTVDEVSFH